MRSNLQIALEQQRAVYSRLAMPMFMQLCRIHGLTVRDLAAIFAISKSYASKLMREEALPPLDLAFRLARYFEVTVDELFGWRVDDTGERRPLVVALPNGKVMRLRAANNEHAALALVRAVAEEMER